MAKIANVRCTFFAFERIFEAAKWKSCFSCACRFRGIHAKKLHKNLNSIPQNALYFWLICDFFHSDFDVFLAQNRYLRLIHKWKSWTSLFPVWWYCKIRVQVCAIKKPLGWPAVKNRGTLGSQPFWKIHVLYHSYFQKRYTWAA